MPLYATSCANSLCSFSGKTSNDKVSQLDDDIHKKHFIMRLRYYEVHFGVAYDHPKTLQKALKMFLSNLQGLDM